METIDFETEARERKISALCVVFHRIATRRPEYMEDLSGYVARLDDESWDMAIHIANEDARKEAERSGEKFVKMGVPKAITRRLVIDALKRGQELGL